MTHLNENDRRALARELEAMRSQVLAELRESAAGAQAGSLDAAHEVRSHADDAESARLGDVRSAEIEVDRLRLAEIEQARQRMADGRYGICVDCGEVIARERLLVRPMAIRCASCQAEAESHQRRRDAAV